MLSVPNFPYSEQVVFVLFVSSHSIIQRHQFQGYHTAKKKKKKDNKQRNELSTLFANQTHRHTEVNTFFFCAAKYWLNIKKSKQSECVYETPP